jgi:hypothetical protein
VIASHSNQVRGSVPWAGGSGEGQVPWVEIAPDSSSSLASSTVRCVCMVCNGQPEASCLIRSLLDSISSVASSFMILHPESLTTGLSYMPYKLSRLLLTDEVFHVRQANSVN